MCREKTKRNRCIVSDWDTEKRRSAGCRVRSSTKCADKVHDKAVDSAGSEPQQMCFVDRREGFGRRSSFARCCGRGPLSVVWHLRCFASWAASAVGLTRKAL